MIKLTDIKPRRKALGLIQEQFAPIAGIGITTLRNIESGANTNPLFGTVRKIERALVELEQKQEREKAQEQGKELTGTVNECAA